VVAALNQLPHYDRATSQDQNRMADHSRIVLNPEVLLGKPVVKGTRLSVEFILGLLSEGWSEGDIFDNYPGLGHEDILACLAYARDLLATEKIYPSAA
jgi:uncharacterized protein (DUF433 family)